MNKLRKQIMNMYVLHNDLSPIQDIAYNLNNLQESIADIKKAIESGDRDEGLIIQRALVSDVNKIWKAYRQVEQQLKKK